MNSVGGGRGRGGGRGQGGRGGGRVGFVRNDTDVMSISDIQLDNTPQVQSQPQNDNNDLISQLLQ
jgi:hypothetical protein